MNTPAFVGAWTKKAARYWELGSGDGLNAVDYHQVNGMLPYGKLKQQQQQPLQQKGHLFMKTAWNTCPLSALNCNV